MFEQPIFRCILPFWYISYDTTITRSYNLLVYKDDDVTVGSDVFQPEGLVQVSRDVVNNVFGSITCIVFHFPGFNYNHQYVLLLPWTPDE